MLQNLDLHPKRWKGPQKALRRSSSSSQQCSEVFAVLFPWICLVDAWKKILSNILPKCWNLSLTFYHEKKNPPENRMTEKSPPIPPSTLGGSPLRVVEENLEDHINSTVPPDQGLIHLQVLGSDLSQDWR